MADHTHAHATPAKEARTYAVILGALLVLTFITVAASNIHWGSGIINVIVALGIATIKATLVALFFMHMRHEKPINIIIFLAGAGFLLLFLISVYTDYAERDPLLPSSYKPAATGVTGPTGPNAPIVPPIPQR
jgi:cytochrome c oxidase subunit 4